MTRPGVNGAGNGWLAKWGVPFNRTIAITSGIFLANFFVAKISIYAAPLAIAAIASGPVYGAIELAQSFGLLISSLLVGAPLAGITQNYLIRKQGEVVDQLAAIAAVFCGLTLFGFVFAYALGLNINILLVTASFASAVIHNVAGTWYRMRAARNISAWVDGTALLLAVGVVALAIIFNGKAELWPVTIGYLALAAVGAICSALLFIRTVKPGWPVRLWEATRIGIPMVIVGTMATWLGVGGRMTIGVLDPKNVAAYGVAFRVAGLALGFHQLAVTGLFAKLYRARTRESDAIISLFLAGVCIILIGIAFAGQLIVDHFDFEALDQNGNALFVQLLPITCLQTFFWIAYAMTQLRVNRSRLAGKSVIPTAVVMGVGIGIIFGASHFFHVGIVGLCWLIAAHAAAFFCVNIVMLGFVGRLPHNRITIVAITGGTILTLIPLIGSFAGA
jgi:O-antigen/teichoic acid export membrane protein